MYIVDSKEHDICYGCTNSNSQIPIQYIHTYDTCIYLYIYTHCCNAYEYISSPVPFDNSPQQLCQIIGMNKEPVGQANPSHSSLLPLQKRQKFPWKVL